MSDIKLTVQSVDEMTDEQKRDRWAPTITIAMPWIPGHRRDCKTQLTRCESSCNCAELATGMRYR